MPFFRLAPLALVLLLAAGCDSSEPEPEPPPPAAPTFAIASQGVTDGGVQGLQFAFTPSTDVTLNLLEIRNPLGQGSPVTLQNLNIPGGVAQALQNDDQYYPRISGEWRFRFRGYLTAQGPGPGSNFEVTTPLTVNARVRNDAPTE